MEKKILYIIMAALLSLIYSCDKMDDSLNKYLDEGEIIYAAKVDTASVYPGKERALVNFYIGAQRIEKVRIYWNDYADSVEVLTNNVAGEFSHIIEDLEEKSYIFQLISIDNYGNESLPVESDGTIYGETYENELVGRSAEIIYTIGGANVTLGTAPDDNTATIVSYINTEGVSSTVSGLSTDDKIIITDNKPDSKYVIYSSFCPEDGIDTLYTENDTISGPFLFSTDDWEIVDYSDQYSAGENGVANVIDGTGETRWHTDGSDYPHYVTVDMGTERTVAQFGVFATTYDNDDKVDTRAPIKIQFLISNDNENWTDLGEFDFDNESEAEQLFSISSLPQARYFKFVGLEGNGETNYMTLGAINAYGY